MAGAIIALVLVVAGMTVRGLAPAVRNRTGDVVAAGRTRLAGYAVMAVGVATLAANTVTVIGVGEVGVVHFLGTVSGDPLEQGVHVVNPLASIEEMSVREQSFPSDGSIEKMDAQTSEQLNVALEVSLLYRLDGQRAPELYQRLGSQAQIEARIVRNAVRNGVRDAIATKSINQVFSPNRRELATAMREAIQTKAGDRIEVLEVFVRDIQAPERVRDAIEAKLQREQQVSAERFQTEIIQERAKQKVEDAKGIAEAQRIINVDLTDRYLMLRYIEALQNLPEGALVVAPTEGGMPVLLNRGR